MNFGKLVKQVKKVVDTKGDKIAGGVDKATDFVDKKTSGKYRDKLQKVDGMAQKLDKTKGQPADDQPEDPPKP